MRCPTRLLASLFVTIAAVFIPVDDAHSFEYLEHAYISDRACWQAQLELQPLLEARPDDDSLRARYLAMALVCPERSPERYCIDERKTVSSQLSRVGGRPWEKSDHPMTLGDFTALGDHLARFGPIRGLVDDQEPGLTEDVLSWLADDDSGVGGVLGRIARRGCYNSEDVSWTEVETDVEEVTEELLSRGSPSPVPSSLLSPLARSAVNQGPSDPEVRFTISNPHYLDLVLRNHLHFGEEAFDTWLGFHSASIEIAHRSCETTYAIGRRTSRRMADDLPGFDDVDWRNLNDSQLAATGCAMLAEHVRLRLLQWGDHADPRLTAPVQDFLDELRALPEGTDAADTAETLAKLDMVVASLKGLVFQGSGLHYLQDAYAGGHIRTIRTRGGLAESRHDHNFDNEEGVSAVIRTRAGDFPFVAFGDQFLLGRHHVSPENCNWEGLAESNPSPERVTACLLRHQRGLMVATSTASIVDWAVDGLLFEPVEPGRCTASDLESSVCNLLPLAPVKSAGTLPPRDFSVTGGLRPGNLPVPPPPFEYESLVTTVAFDVGGTKAQYGLQFTMLSQFDRYAHWLTSYRAALLATTGSGVGDDNKIMTEFSYNFHYRISARVMADTGLGAFAGFRGIGDDLSFMSGITPSAGLTVLPEGWVKIPIDLSVSFRMPMTFFTSTHGFFSDSINIEAFWLQFGLGLAFM